jgi:hypothetical protein
MSSDRPWCTLDMTEKMTYFIISINLMARIMVRILIYIWSRLRVHQGLSELFFNTGNSVNSPEDHDIF